MLSGSQSTRAAILGVSGFSLYTANGHEFEVLDLIFTKKLINLFSSIPAVVLKMNEEKIGWRTTPDS